MEEFIKELQELMKKHEIKQIMLSPMANYIQIIGIGKGENYTKITDTYVYKG